MFDTEITTTTTTTAIYLTADPKIICFACHECFNNINNNSNNRPKIICFACNEQSVKHPQTFFFKKNDYRRVKNTSE